MPKYHFTECAYCYRNTSITTQYFSTGKFCRTAPFCHYNIKLTLLNSTNKSSKCPLVSPLRSFSNDLPYAINSEKRNKKRILFKVFHFAVYNTYSSVVSLTFCVCLLNFGQFLGREVVLMINYVKKK